MCYVHFSAISRLRCYQLILYLVLNDLKTKAKRRWSSILMRRWFILRLTPVIMTSLLRFLWREGKFQCTFRSVLEFVTFSSK